MKLERGGKFRLWVSVWCFEAETPNLKPSPFHQIHANDDTGIGVNTVRKGKIRVKSLVVEYG